MGMAQDVQDGRDAASRARSTKGTRRRPIRYDVDTWLVMRNDPVLPAAVVLRLRNPDRGEFFVTVTWDLDPENRRMLGRYATLQDADTAVLYTPATPIVPHPNEDMESLQKRHEQRSVELERERAERAKTYGP